MSTKVCKVHATSNIFHDRWPTFFPFGKPKYKAKLITIAERPKKEPKPVVAAPIEQDQHLSVRVNGIRGSFKYNSTTCEYVLSGRLQLKARQDSRVANLQLIFNRGKEN